MHWILQTNLFKETGWDHLVTALERLELPYTVHKVVPFSGELIPVPDPQQAKVICFGSYSMRHPAILFGWTPGVYDLIEQCFEEQLKHWGTHMLNHDSKVSRFEDANFTGHAFVRPTTDSKPFAGRVFSQEEFYDWKHRVCALEHDYGTSLSKNTLVQVVIPKEIYAEYRFWVVGGRIVTQCLYKRGGRIVYSPDVDEKFGRFVKIRIKEWSPHRAFVIDVCEIERDVFNDGPYADDASIKIVEINTINSSGFYAADVTKLVIALEALEQEAPMNPIHELVYSRGGS